MFRSGPTVIACGWLPAFIPTGWVNSVTASVTGLIIPIAGVAGLALVPASANHMLPSGPSAIPIGVAPGLRIPSGMPGPLTVSPLATSGKPPEPTVTLVEPAVVMPVTGAENLALRRALVSAAAADRVSVLPLIETTV